VTGNTDALCAVGSRDNRPLRRLGADSDPDESQDEQDEEDKIGRHKRPANPFGEHSRNQRSDSESAQVGDPRDDLTTLRSFARTRHEVQTDYMRRDRGREHADAETGDDTRCDQAGKGGPHNEEHRRNDLQADSRQEELTPAETVTQVPEEEESDDGARGIGGKGDGDGERAWYNPQSGVGTVL
jgi:hypothetical protein